MAEQNEAASRTEEPTPRKLQQAREKGDVVKTPDLAPLAAMAASAAVLAVGGGWYMQRLAGALLPFIAHPDSMSLHGQGGVNIAADAMLAAAPLLLSVVGAAAVAGAAGNLVQHGLLFNPEKLSPDFSKVSPLAGFKRLFGLDALMQFIKSLAKVTLVGVIAWWVLKPHMAELQMLSALGPAAILPVTTAILVKLVFSIAMALGVIAGADWFWQRQRFLTRNRMSKEELKDEYKQTEGDPHVKARQKQIRNERSRRRMMQAVPTATMVVMNPTHFAVALKYDAGETPAPLCVAKGLDSLALKIREVAEAHGVPIVEDPPLARSLYASVDIDDIIPPTHYEAVAKIIGFIMGGRRPGGASPPPRLRELSGNL